MKWDNAGYRIVGRMVVPITNQEELQSIEQAQTTEYESVNKHILKATQLFSRRPTPDFENSIKESISAVEALCCIITNDKKATLGDALADYFTTITPAVNDATVETIAKILQDDIDHYPNVRAVADQNNDRGAARICVWGEKVTRMLSSLVNRYLNEGEAMLADTNIWVCTVCGFVYIGENAPELCPVCKVPAWKFEKTEGRA